MLVVTVDSVEGCMSEEVFSLPFRNMISSDGLSAFALNIGAHRPVSHAHTDD